MDEWLLDLNIFIILIQLAQGAAVYFATGDIVYWYIFQSEQVLYALRFVGEWSI